MPPPSGRVARVQVAHQLARRSRCSRPWRRPGASTSTSYSAEVGHRQLLAQPPAVGVGRRGHPRSPSGASAASSGTSRPASSNSVCRVVRPQPLLEHPQVLGVLGQARQRHLVAAEGALDLDAVDHVGPGPALRGAQDDRRPRCRPALEPSPPAPRPGSPGSSRAASTAARPQAPGTPARGSSPDDDHGVPALAAQVGLDVLVASCGRAPWGRRSCSR